MVQITLYIPNSTPEVYEVENGLNEGRLHFRVGDGEGSYDVMTTLPYLIRQPAVKSRGVSRAQSRPPRIGEPTAWS